LDSVTKEVTFVQLSGRVGCGKTPAIALYNAPQAPHLSR